MLQVLHRMLEEKIIDDNMDGLWREIRQYFVDRQPDDHLSLGGKMYNAVKESPGDMETSQVLGSTVLLQHRRLLVLVEFA